MIDVLLVGLGSTAGLRAADAELRGALERAGASVAQAVAAPQRDVRTLALTDLVWARAARVAARAAIAEHAPRAIVYSSTTAALLWPQPGAIRFDAPAAGNRPGRHGVWQRRMEDRRLAAATVVVPWSEGALAETRARHAGAVVVPVPVQSSGPRPARRDITAITYAANPHKKGLDRVLAAWEQARRRADEVLVVAGTEYVPQAAGVRNVGLLEPDAYRALVRRARLFVTAPRREDHGIAQLEALADGCQLVTTVAPGPYAALPIARSLAPGAVVDAPDDHAALARAIRTALDDPPADHAARAARAMEPFRPEAIDAVVRDELLPRLLAG